MQLEHLSALELGKLVNRKIISPVEVIEYFEDRIETHNKKINAFTYTRFEEAEKRAKAMETAIMKGCAVGPLAGVPIALKDFLPSKEGWTHSHGGVKAIADWIDPESSEFTKACESLGAIAIGKTNAPSFGFRGVTDNFMYGPTSTPFNLEYNSGGSSGGSCAAVSGGLVLAAEQGDAGGSARIPAAWCGCFGFKPSAGIVPSVCRPDAWTATHPYCCGGPATKTVDDAAVILDKMIRYNPKDPISIPTPRNLMYLRGENTVASDETSPLQGMKIALTYDFNLFPMPDDEIRHAIEKVAKILSDAGADVDLVVFSFHYTRQEIEDAWLRGICVDTAIDMEIWKSNGADLVGKYADQLPAAYIRWNDIALKSTMMDYRKFHDIRTDILDAHNRVFEDYDIILAPVTGCMPVSNSVKSEDGLVQGPTRIGKEDVDPMIGFGYTYLENMIGTPAASIPVCLGSENRPIGAQIIGRRYHDDDVFRVCYSLEHFNPWMHHYTRSYN